MLELPAVLTPSWGRLETVVLPHLLPQWPGRVISKAALARRLAPWAEARPCWATPQPPSACWRSLLALTLHLRLEGGTRVQEKGGGPPKAPVGGLFPKGAGKGKFEKHQPLRSCGFATNFADITAGYRRGAAKGNGPHGGAPTASTTQGSAGEGAEGGRFPPPLKLAFPPRLPHSQWTVGRGLMRICRLPLH